MRIARLEITRFRGFESFVLIPRHHVVIVGEPRAGRSDLIAALRRVLDPRGVLSRPSEWDVFRPLPDSLPRDPDVEGESDAQLTSIELSLLNLPETTKQTLQDRLELLDPVTGEIVEPDGTDTAELGIRLRYCLRYDLGEERLEHWIEFPKSGTRVPRGDRELLRAFVLDRNAPLQLRAEGALRRLANDPDREALSKTLQEFANDIATATETLSQSDEVQSALRLVAAHGARRLLELDRSNPTAAIGSRLRTAPWRLCFALFSRPLSWMARASFRCLRMARRQRPSWQRPRRQLPRTLATPSCSRTTSATSSTQHLVSTLHRACTAGRASSG